MKRRGLAAAGAAGVLLASLTLVLGLTGELPIVHDDEQVLPRARIRDEKGLHDVLAATGCVELGAVVLRQRGWRRRGGQIPDAQVAVIDAAA